MPSRRPKTKRMKKKHNTVNLPVLTFGCAAIDTTASSKQRSFAKHIDGFIFRTLQL